MTQEQRIRLRQCEMQLRLALLQIAAWEYEREQEPLSAIPLGVLEGELRLDDPINVYFVD